MSDALRIATPVADAPRPATLTQRASLNVIATLLYLVISLLLLIQMLMRLALADPFQACPQPEPRALPFVRV